MPIISLSNAQQRITQAAFALPVAPVYRDSLILYTPPPDDRQGTSDLTGVIAGDFQGSVDEISGLTLLDSTLVDGVLATTLLPSALRVNVVGYSFVPTDPALLGLDGTLLPPDMRVPIFWKGGRLLVHSTKRETLSSPLAPAQQIQLSRQNLAWCRLWDQNDVQIPTARYSCQLATGVLTMANPLDLTGYVQPLIAAHRIQDLCTISSVDLGGKISFTPALGHAYDADDTFVSTVLYLGTLQALIYPWFTQSAWTSVWSDARIGDAPLGAYDTISYPPYIENRWAVGDQYLLLFRTSQSFDFIGRHRGLIAQGNINEDFEPLNTLTGYPYLRLNKAGWGGMSAGNGIRFNIVPPSRGVHAIRTIMPSRTAAGQDSIFIELWGNASV